jgi:hypothetical protein
MDQLRPYGSFEPYELKASFNSTYQVRKSALKQCRLAQAEQAIAPPSAPVILTSGHSDEAERCSGMKPNGIPG